MNDNYEQETGLNEEEASLFYETFATLQLISSNGGVVGLNGQEARALVSEMDRLARFEGAYLALQSDYNALVLAVDLEEDEMAEVIADTKKELEGVTDFLRYLLYRYGEEDLLDSPVIEDAQQAIFAADAYLKHYQTNVKGVTQQRDHEEGNR